MRSQPSRRLLDPQGVRPRASRDAAGSRAAHRAVRTIARRKTMKGSNLCAACCSRPLRSSQASAPRAWQSSTNRAPTTRYHAWVSPARDKLYLIMGLQSAARAWPGNQSLRLRWLRYQFHIGIGSKLNDPSSTASSKTLKPEGPRAADPAWAAMSSSGG